MIVMTTWCDSDNQNNQLDKRMNISEMTLVDRIEVVAQVFAKVAANYWPLVVLVVGTIVIGSIYELRDNQNPDSK